MDCYIQWAMPEMPPHSLHELTRCSIYDGTFEPEPPIHSLVGTSYEISQYSADNIYLLKLSPDSDPFVFALNQSIQLAGVVLSVFTQEHRTSFRGGEEVDYLDIDKNLICT